MLRSGIISQDSGEKRESRLPQRSIEKRKEFLQFFLVRLATVFADFECLGILNLFATLRTVPFDQLGTKAQISETKGDIIIRIGLRSDCGLAERLSVVRAFFALTGLLAFFVFLDFFFSDFFWVFAVARVRTIRFLERLRLLVFFSGLVFFCLAMCPVFFGR